MAIAFVRSGLVLTCALLAGCASLRTAPLSEGVSQGIVYYLPKGLTPVEVVEIRKANAPPTRTLRLGETQYVADTAHPCRLLPQPSLWSDDAVKVTLAPEGFLAGVDVTAHDRTGDIVVRLAKAAATLAPAAVGEQVVVYSALVDLTDSAAVQRLNAVLAESCKGLAIAVDAGPAGPAATPPPPAPASGIYYRPVRPVTVTVTSGADVRTRVLLLPSASHLLALPVNRSAFVKKVTHIRFENGLLQSFTLDKPSEALAAVSIPVEIGKAIVSVPAELLQIRIDQSAKDKSRLDVERKRLEAEEALRVVRAKLATEKSDPLSE